MSNDWSLAGKDIKTLHLNHLDGARIKITFPDYGLVFPTKEIEKLRAWLIEDILEFDSLDSTEIIEQINKRFGVKDGKED